MNERELQPQPAFPIVVVLVDALRADRIGAVRGSHAVAPNLAAFAKDAATFRNAFSSAPKTIPSVPQIFTSQYFPDIAHERTLLSVLADAGYETTAAFIHNPYVVKWLGRLDPTFDHLSAGELSAERISDLAIAWLGSRKTDRFAMYLHYLDVHMPVTPPEDIARQFVHPDYHGPIGLSFGDMKGAWAGRYDAADQERIAELYDAAVAATDAQIGRFFEALRSGGLYDRALIVVTADHGEELWDHGGFFHGHTLYDELLRVPLLVKFPGAWAAGTNVDALARSVDILPTISDLLRRADPPRYAKAPAEPAMDGESLVAVVSGSAPEHTLFATVARVDDRSPPLHAVRTRTAKLISDVRTGTDELYDVTRDPHEHDNLATDPSRAPMLADLREMLRVRLEPLTSTGVHARLSNGTSTTLHYRIDVALDPIAPFANLARLGLEPGDVVAQNPRADGFGMHGVLEPGDHDEIRFDVLADAGTLVATIVTDEPAVPVQFCAASEPSCVKPADVRSSIALGRLETPSAPTPRAASSLQVEWWKIKSQSAPLPMVLSPADRERLRALGYAE